MRGIVGTMDARTALSAIMPLRLPARSDVIATTGEVRWRSSWYTASECIGVSLYMASLLERFRTHVRAVRLFPRPGTAVVAGACGPPSAAPPALTPGGGGV